MRHKGKLFAIVLTLLSLAVMIVRRYLISGPLSLNQLSEFFEIALIYGIIFWMIGTKFDKTKMEIIKRIQIEEKLKESEERYRSLVEISPQIIVLHGNKKIIYVNPAGIRTIGAASMDDFVGRSILDFIHPDYHQIIMERLKKVLDGEDIEFIELKLITNDGREVFVETKSSIVKFMGENVVLTVINDISKQKKSEEKLRYFAFYDQLTGLPNRNSLEKYIKNILIQKEQRVAFLMIDLDRFKLINDTYGHRVGDLVLKHVAELLQKCIGDEGQIFRFGGDEFICIVEEAVESKIIEVARKLTSDHYYPLNIKEHEIFISYSVGISLYPIDGLEQETLFKKADIAMYQAKKDEGNTYQFYKDEIKFNSLQKIEIEKDLRKALDNEEFVLNYQPKIDLFSGEIVGLEALIRWHHPNLGVISPVDFIPDAEETGLIVPIGEWVLENAVKDVKALHEEGFKLNVAVNISVRQFYQRNFVDMIKRIIKENDYDPRCLDLEITESIVQNVDESVLILKQLKDLGIMVSIDDFGTGYSSLSLLNKLPIDNLKIDKSFIQELVNDKSMETIVKTIIAMGKILNFKVIAEGIDNKQQVDFLKQQECHIGQGYYFSRPITIRELKKLITVKAVKKDKNMMTISK
ncbi:hypothetical protein BHF71_07705 [Vulcanibacillus modesticaldus]|uniref:Diguanylate cyclase n=1 Tax=Vulcanibacillus modesticaldus TaxID=337097 RepID=A0A1D2YVF4_9BACI|nr:EAL domain-containing protein [Vulcanibacillus modesticaldus]OEF99704.1 hypothetical protein BHF71_07705 [Vulcanibacillus modesticaldus]